MAEFTSYQTLIQSLDAAVIITDLESRVEVWNPAAERTYGWKYSQIKGKNLGEFVPTKFERLEEDAESARETLLKTGVWRGTVIQHHKDGKPINIDSMVCLLKNEQGQPEKMAAINRDITDEKMQSEALKRLENLSHTVSHQASIEDVFKAFTNEVKTLFSVDSITLVQMDENLTSFILHVLHDNLSGETKNGQSYPLQNSLTAVVAQTHRPLIIPDIRQRKYTNLSSLNDEGIRSIMLLPLLAGERFLGTVNLYSREVGAYTIEKSEKIQHFVEQLTIALHQSQIMQGNREAQSRLREISLQLIRSQEDERARLARELHDEIGQMLTAMKLDLRNVLDSADIGQFSGASILREDLGVASDLLERIRNLSLDLHPPLLDDLGLAATLRWHLSRMAERGNLQAHFSAPEALGEIPSDVALTFYRITQESLTNILRHAQAKNVWLEIQRQNGLLRLQIKDDGIGFSPEARQNHLGLRAMRERADLLGAHLDLETAPAKGTSIALTWESL